ncbi:MAG TPA: molybdopterin-dependent oxidoreductase [Gemmatimonas sp.]|uniref:molybdopterin-dependent oxidoreductase n=1 Tax=Gemmatimonas sp. TaxID=1962908 RepID=UPI002ED9C6A9
MVRLRTSRFTFAAAMPLAFVGTACALAAPAAAQQSVRAEPTVQVTGAVTQSLTLKASDLAAMPRASVRTESNGIVTTYEGVWVAEVLKKAGAPLGNALRGAALSTYVVAMASDGYQVVFSLGELDPEMSGGQFLLADRANGESLFGETGAFRLVVPTDKRGARSVRMLSSLQVVTVRK